MRPVVLELIEEELRQRLDEGRKQGLSDFATTSLLLTHEREQNLTLTAALYEITKIASEALKRERTNLEENKVVEQIYFVQ